MKNNCQCCDGPGPVASVKSRLKKGISFNLCGKCISENHEPKFWVILFGRANGVRVVERQLKSHQYCGNEILARELL